MRAGYQKVVEQDPGRTVIIFNPARRKWLPNWLKSPHMTVAADFMWCDLSWDASYEQYQGHPRTAGTHGKTLAIETLRQGQNGAGAGEFIQWENLPGESII